MLSHSVLWGHETPLRAVNSWCATFDTLAHSKGSTSLTLGAVPQKRGSHFLLVTGLGVGRRVRATGPGKCGKACWHGKFSKSSKCFPVHVRQAVPHCPSWWVQPPTLRVSLDPVAKDGSPGRALPCGPCPAPWPRKGSSHGLAPPPPLYCWVLLCRQDNVSTDKWGMGLGGH
jgi:hypothetical protein